MEYQSLSEFIHRYVIRWSWLLLIALVLAGNTAYLVSKMMMTPIYQASTTLLIEKPPNSQTSEYTSILASEQLAQTYAEMITIRPVLEETIERLQLDTAVESLLGTINIQSLPDTRLLELQVEHPIPSGAAMIANTIVEVFTEFNQDLQGERYAASKQSLELRLEQIDGQIQATNDSLNALEDIPQNKFERDRLELLLTDYQQSYIPLLQSYEEIRVLEASNAKIIQLGKAVPPDDFIRPRIWLNTILAAVVGLMLTAGIIYLIESLDETIKYPEEITQLFGIQILGFIAQHKNSPDGPITLTTSLSPIAESFRTLRENIRNMDQEKPIHSLAITSASDSPGAGSSTVAANLAVVMAQARQNVMLIDSDLRKPKLQDIFNLPNKTGLIDLIAFPEHKSFDGVHKSIVNGLSIITSGGVIKNPYDLLNSHKFISIFLLIKSQVDLVVIDTAPVNLVSDAMRLSKEVDGIILVVKPEHTTKNSMSKAIEQYTRIGARILGVVVNGYKPSRRSSYYHKGNYYGQSSYSENGSGDKKQKTLKEKVSKDFSRN